jgi:transposase
MGEIILSQHEQKRLLVLNALNRRDLTMAKAGQLLGLSVRQVRRVRRAYQLRGAAALAHGNRGRRSPRRLGDALRRRIVRLARTTYAAVNHQHFTELLREREEVGVSRQTVSRLLREAGIPSPRRRRPPKHRTRRERMPQEGMLVQFDGSHHLWLEDRGPRLVLHAAVDDATGKVLAGWFDEEETAAGYFHVFRQLALGPGLPWRPIRIATGSLGAPARRAGRSKKSSKVPAPPPRWDASSRSLGSRLSLDRLEGLLEPHGFLRSHRAFLVNLRHVRRIVPWSQDAASLMLDDGKETLVPLAKSHRRALRSALLWP